jgi:hypothetical protein
MSADQKPLDMNEVIRDQVNHAIDARTGNIIASALISSGNAQRNAGYGILGPVTDKDLLTKPALLSTNGSLLLVPFIRPTVQMFKLLVSHDTAGKRSFVAFVEDENQLLQSKFLNMTDEIYAELDRQVNAIGMTYEGNALLGLIIADQPVEGYEYFKPAVEETTAGAPVSGDTPAAAVVEVAAPAVAAEVAANAG